MRDERNSTGKSIVLQPAMLLYRYREKKKRSKTVLHKDMDPKERLNDT
jgi:hypothetical protein